MSASSFAPKLKVRSSQLSPTTLLCVASFATSTRMAKSAVRARARSKRATVPRLANQTCSLALAVRIAWETVAKMTHPRKIYLYERKAKRVSICVAPVTARAR